MPRWLAYALALVAAVVLSVAAIAVGLILYVALNA